MSERTEGTKEIFGNPIPLGLIGLAIGCAALTPFAFGFGINPAGFRTAAMWALLFGAGCQFIAGLMCFANRNSVPGTLFTAFTFLWVINGWTLYSVSRGQIPDPSVTLSTEIILLIIFAFFTYAFGFFSNLLFAFLVDIDLLFVARISKSIIKLPGIDVLIGLLTIGMGLIALWIAFATILFEITGKMVMPLGRPIFKNP